MDTKHKLRDMLLNLVLVLLIGYVLLHVYWAFYPYKTVVINNSPYPTEKTEYKAGETVKYTVDYCKFVDMPSKLSKTLVGATYYVAPTQLSNASGVGCNVITSSFKLPQDVNTGVHKIEIVSEFQVNPDRMIHVDSETQEFDIIE